MEVLPDDTKNKLPNPALKQTTELAFSLQYLIWSERPLTSKSCCVGM